jgi:EmrB/QacA subfamily drug resistance transporter
MPSTRNSHALDRGTMIVSGVVLLGAVMALLDETVVNVALDRLGTEFQAPFTTIQWVVSAYTLALAAVIPLAGWASDRFGTRRVYLCAVAAFTLGSAFCAIAWSPASLIAFRVLQGLGGGLVAPVVMTIIAKKAGPQRRGAVMGILGVPLLATPVLGLVVGGWLVDSVSWRAIFLVNLPVGALAIVLARIVLEPDLPQPGHRLDWLGVALLSPGLSLLIFGFAQSPAHGIGAALTWLPILAGLVLIGAFLVHAWRAPAPLIDVKTFVRTQAGAAGATLLLLTISLFGALLLMPVYFQVVRGASALEAGMLLSPWGLGAMIAMPLAGRIVDRRRPSWMAACGVPLLAIGMVPFATVADSTPFVVLCASTLLIGVGIPFTFMPAVTAALQAVPERQIARTSTAVNVIEQSGISIGTAILSVLLVTAISGALPGVGGTDALAQLSNAQRALHSEQLASAFASTFTWALAAIVATMVPALALGRSLARTRVAEARRRPPEPAAEQA